MTKRIYSQEHIDFMLELLSNPKRIVAMGLGPAVLDAARRGGWKPPPECTPKPAAAKPGNVINFEARRGAKLEAKASHPESIDGDPYALRLAQLKESLSFAGRPVSDRDLAAAIVVERYYGRLP